MASPATTPKIGLSQSEAERRYGLGRRTLARAIAAGELRAARLGRRRLVILASDLEAWLASHSVTPVAAGAREHARHVVSARLAREREGKS